MIRGFLIVVTMMWAGVANSAVYRCDVGGKPMLSGTPCEEPKPLANGVEIQRGNASQIVGPYDTPYGEWRGQAQFQAARGTQQLDDVHAVQPIVLRASPDGKLVGVVTEGACKLLGLVTPGITPQMLNVDVTLHECAKPELNRRYSGSLILNPREKLAELRVTSFSSGLDVATSAEVRAVLRR